MRYSCPACGFLVFSEVPGSYEICAVCGWEDDPVQLANPCTEGGANRESLKDAQARALEDCPIGQMEECGWRRDATWRPLTEAEITHFMELSDGGRRSGQRAIRDPKDYYWRTSGESISTPDSSSARRLQ